METLGRGIRDLMAQGPFGALAFAGSLMALLPTTVRRRRFHCPWSRREVEVEFVERGLPGVREPRAVRSCSVFDPPTAVACPRRCLDAAYRRQWEPALPIRTSWTIGVDERGDL